MPVEGSNQTSPTEHQQHGFSPVHTSSQASPSSRPSPNVFTDSSLANFAARMPESYVNSFCGAVAGAASGIVTCPLDVIKTKLQAQGGFRPLNAATAPGSKVYYHGLLGTASTIWRQDGLRGMYRGLGPMLFGYLPTWAVYMSVYGGSRDYFYTQMDNKWLAQVYASITAGAASTLVTNPIWVIKTRLMSQVGAKAAKDTRTPWYYRNTRDAFRQMYRAEGFRAFYSGLAPAFLGLSHVAIQFPLYEYFKLQFTGLGMGEHQADDKSHHTFGILSATFLSKICATSATYPHEVLRTRLQTQQRQRYRGENGSPHGQEYYLSGTKQPTRAVRHILDPSLSLPRYSGVIATCQTILREEGWRAFYNGMGTNMIRAVPSAMTTMLTFESLKRTIHRIQDQASAEVET